MDYQIKCKETVERVLKETRNLPDLQIQQALNKNFPFHRNNLSAWREYAKQIKELSGRAMYGY